MCVQCLQQAPHFLIRKADFSIVGLLSARPCTLPSELYVRCFIIVCVCVCAACAALCCCSVTAAFYLLLPRMLTHLTAGKASISYVIGRNDKGVNRYAV